MDSPGIHDEPRQEPDDLTTPGGRLFRYVREHLAATHSPLSLETWAKQTPGVGEISRIRRGETGLSLDKLIAVHAALGRPWIEVLHGAGLATDEELAGAHIPAIPEPDALFAIENDPRLNANPKARAQLLSLAQHFLLPD